MRYDNTSERARSSTEGDASGCSGCRLYVERCTFTRIIIQHINCNLLNSGFRTRPFSSLYDHRKAWFKASIFTFHMDMPPSVK